MKVVDALVNINVQGMSNMEWEINQIETNSKLHYGSAEDFPLKPHVAIWSNEENYSQQPEADLELTIDNDNVVLIYFL